jgi:hypothetical protein
MASGSAISVRPPLRNGFALPDVYVVVFAVSAQQQSGAGQPVSQHRVLGEGGRSTQTRHFAGYCSRAVARRKNKGIIARFRRVENPLCVFAGHLTGGGSIHRSAGVSGAVSVCVHCPRSI